MLIKSLQDINAVLKEIKQPDDSGEINQETFLLKILEKLVLLPAALDELENLYENYKKIFDGIVLDVDKLKKADSRKITFLWERCSK